MKNKTLMYVGIGVGIFILILIGLYFLGRSDSNLPNSSETVGIGIGANNTSQVKTQPANNQSPSTVAVLPKETFTSGLGSWYEEVWYAKKDSGGEVTAGSDGLTFKGVQSNSRSGIMIDLNRDVSEFKNLTLSAVVTTDTQTLSGTGWNGREAPVAIAISYEDANGVDHKLLGDDPKAMGQIFWRGFYYLDPNDGKAGTVNGIKVTQGVPYNFTFDLMSLSPKPKKIYYVAVEGAGWSPRVGRVSSISITGEK